jgi:hypothetical protein
MFFVFDSFRDGRTLIPVFFLLLLGNGTGGYGVGVTISNLFYKLFITVAVALSLGFGELVESCVLIIEGGGYRPWEKDYLQSSTILCSVRVFGRRYTVKRGEVT